MSRYVEMCRKIILPKSHADTLSEAFQEWKPTGRVKDYRKPCEVCGLCDYKPLRWHYHIKSTDTDHELWVGSQCIENFAAAAAATEGERENDSPEDLDERIEEARSDMREKIRELEREYKKEQVIDRLRLLYSRETNSDFQDMIHSIAEAFKKQGALSPKQIQFLVWRSKEREVNLPIDYLKVDLRRKKYKRQMATLEDWKIRQFWNVLSRDQQKRAKDRGWVRS